MFAKTDLFKTFSFDPYIAQAIRTPKRVAVPKGVLTGVVTFKVDVDGSLKDVKPAQAENPNKQRFNGETPIFSVILALEWYPRNEMTAPDHSSSEKDLLRLVAKGDHRAFRVLYDRYAPKTQAFALRILQDDMLAEEVMQETMLKLWQLGDKLTEIEHLNAYLKTLSRNYCYNLLRRKQLELRVEGEMATEWDEANNDTEELILLNEARQLLQQAVDTLPQYHRRVYELCHQQGLKYHEAAEQLGLSPHSVKTYMKQALKSIREFLRDRGDFAVLLLIFKLF